MKYYIPEVDQSVSKVFGAGISAEYYRLSRTLGIKIFHVGSKQKPNKIPKNILTEFLLQVKSEPSGIVPKAYQICQAQSEDFGTWHWAIIMDHCLSEEIVDDDYDIFVRIDGKRIKKEDLYFKLEQKLRSQGVNHLDIFGANVLIHKGKAKVIDFGCATSD